MEKLLQLLNEYNCNKLWYVDKWEIKNNKFILDYKIWTYAFRTHLYIISKEYWFIQWLVQNNKTKEVAYWLWYTSYSEWENLIRLLSIQDEPIRFLVSILK